MLIDLYCITNSFINSLIGHCLHRRQLSAGNDMYLFPCFLKISMKINVFSVGPISLPSVRREYRRSGPWNQVPILRTGQIDALVKVAR